MIKAKDASGRLVEFTVHGCHDDLYIADAYYLDTDEEVDDDTVEYLTHHYQELMYNAWLDYQIMRAESWSEIDR